MKKGVLLQIIGFELIGIALLALILMAWFLYFEPLWLQSQAQANFVVATLVPTATATPVPTKTTPTVTPTALPTDLPTYTPTSSPSPTPTATPIPHTDYQLEVDSIGLDWIVHHITPEEVNDEPWGIPKTILDRYGVVDFPHLAFPGEEGIVGIAGHRDMSGNPFWYIDKIAIGDEIRLTLPSGQIYRYTVYNVVTVKPDDPIFWTTAGTHELRLVSCLIGSTRMRVIIFAQQNN